MPKNLLFAESRQNQEDPALSRTDCPQRILLQGFWQTNGYYTLGWGSGQNGFYAQHYVQEGGPNCIYRSRTRNHWWINDCSELGLNGGFEYLPSNYGCPSDGRKGDWRKGGTDAVLYGLAKPIGE